MIACIFDLDGTIADSSHRSHHLRRGPVDWVAWESGISDDSPIGDVISILKSLAESGYRILLATSRAERCRQSTEEWLNQNAIPYDRLFMRQNHCDGDAYAVKSSHVYRIIAAGYHPVLAFDDDEASCLAYAHAGVSCCRVSPVYRSPL